MRVTLKVLAGPYMGQVFSFDQHDTFLIGRSDQAHLYLPNDRFFSRNHCLLEIAPPRCFLRDLGSANGTFVNNRRVQEAHLKNGDRVQGGQTIMEIEVSADAAFTPSGHLASTQPAIVMVECLRCGRPEKAEAASPTEKLTFICEDCRADLKKHPQPIPGYATIKILGKGGMGSVVLAQDERNGDMVAIKTMLPEIAVSEQAMKRFMREIEVAAALQHPHIVRYINHYTHEGVVYFITEFVAGADAAKLADERGGRLPWQETVQIIAQALDALDFAHQKGYIHRDIKDQNILVGGAWPHYSAKLTDFGLAKSFTQTGMSGVTMAGDVAGTFAYMPPEQIRDFKNVKPISDVYAMGMTAYSLLTGYVALDLPARAGVAETVKAIFEKPIIPTLQRAPDVPPAIAQVVDRAIAKDANQRWATASAFRSALLQVSGMG
jgi:serine/threonine-protein kinase